MAKETSNEQHLLSMILEELQQSNQELTAQSSKLQELNERINQPALYEFPERRLEELQKTLHQYHARLLQPVPAKVRHYYCVHNTTVIAVIFFIGLIALSWLCLDKSAKLRELKSNDIKYRHLKLSGNLNLVLLLNATDSLYTHDPCDFKRNVVDKERIRKKQPDLTLNEKTKEKQTKNLRRKAEKTRHLD